MNFDLTWGDGGARSTRPIIAPSAWPRSMLSADAANRWIFSEVGEPWSGVATGAYIAGGECAGHPLRGRDRYDFSGRGLANRAPGLHRGARSGVRPGDKFLRENAGYGGIGGGLRVRRSLPVVPSLNLGPVWAGLL